MSEFAAALLDKIRILETQHSKLESKLEALRELYLDEVGEFSAVIEKSPKVAKKRGRPRKRAGVEKPPIIEDDLTREALSMEGTDPEIAKRLASRKLSLSPRPMRSLGPGIKAGRPEDVEKGRSTITGVGKRDMKNSEPEEDLD